MGVAQLKRDIAKNVRKSMRTKYLPHISALGSYQHTSKPISLLSDEQKTSLSNLGTSTGSMLQGLTTPLQGKLSALQGDLTSFGTVLGSLGLPTTLISNVGNDLGQLQQGMATGIDAVTGLLNVEGQKIVDAFNTDTRNIWAGTVMAVQPVFMGGSIVAMNKLADLGEKMAENSEEAGRQMVIYSVDKTYWQVVSLKNKKRLAESYLDVVRKLDGDVQKMISEGVATRSDGLSVSVKVNEAEMAVQKVNDGLVLSRMLLCQMVGLPMNETVTLADEDKENLEVTASLHPKDMSQTVENRPELKILDNTVEMTRQMTNVLKAGNLPMVALMGGYSVSNPSLLNGFEKKFRGLWNVGVLVRVPLWNWGVVMYKVRASKGVSAIASLEREEIREKMELQLNQSSFKVDEANRRLIMANTSVEKADENLRMANVGFREGVITPTTVMEAQTAWLLAKSQQIDAQIDVLMSTVDLRKAQGELGIEN